MRVTRTTLVGGTVAVLLVAGCSSETKKDIGAAVARNAVAVGMKKEFSDHQHALDGLPTCTATAIAGSTSRFNIACKAKTEKGEPATLIGRTDGENEVRGTFKGFVNNVEIFSDTCIGC